MRHGTRRRLVFLQLAVGIALVSARSSFAQVPIASAEATRQASSSPPRTWTSPKVGWAPSCGWRILFGLDVIHGYRTLFPIPLGMASSWDPAVEEQAQAFMARAQVRGFQGSTLGPNSVVACAKHFAGYGAAEGGRDYDASYIPEAKARSPRLHTRNGVGRRC
jgi:hypothetical protein